MPKMNVNLTLTKDYRKNDCLADQKTNPKQSQFKPNQTLSCISRSPERSRRGSRMGQFLQRPKPLTKKSSHTRLACVPKIVCKNAPFGYTHPDCRATAGFAQTRAIHVARKGFGDGGK